MDSIRLKHLFYPLLDLLPHPWGYKLKMIGRVLLFDFRSSLPIPREVGELFREVTPERIDAVCGGLPEADRARMKRYVEFIRTAVDREYTGRYLYDCSPLGLAREFRRYAVAAAELERLRKEFHLEIAEASSLIHHHGLKKLPQSALDRLRGLDFIDAGAFNGDSALVLLNYDPGKVYSFDPDEGCRESYLRTMKLNRIPEERYGLISAALDFASDTGMTTVDEFVGRRGLRCGLIKADVEGAGLKLIKGAMNTIRTRRPVLLISIYHCPDEFLGVYRRLVAENLPYDFRVFDLGMPGEPAEITLVAIPRENSAAELHS